MLSSPSPINSIAVKLSSLYVAVCSRGSQNVSCRNHASNANHEGWLWKSIRLQIWTNLYGRHREGRACRGTIIKNYIFHLLLYQSSDPINRHNSMSIAANLAWNRKSYKRGHLLFHRVLARKRSSHQVDDQIFLPYLCSSSVVFFLYLARATYGGSKGNY